MAFDSDSTPVMLFPVRTSSGTSPRSVGEMTYVGPCVNFGERVGWQSNSPHPRDIGEITYMGPALRPEDLFGK
ncbi:MAG: hypothetical protein ABI743_08830 [bacterium]